MFLFSTDIDGTVYDGPTTAVMFREFWSELRTFEMPPTLAYNSGRSLSDTRGLIKETDLPEPEFIIGGVGTEIFDFRKNAIIREWDEELSEDWEFDLVKQTVLKAAQGAEPQPDRCQGQFKCSWFWHDKCESDLEPLKIALAATGMKTQVIYSSKRDLDVVPLKANKGNAAVWLSHRLGVSREHVIVAGDSCNDSSMFLIDEFSGIVVSNAEDLLKSTVSGTNTHLATKPCAAGVIEGIERWLDQRSSTCHRGSSS